MPKKTAKNRKKKLKGFSPEEITMDLEMLQATPGWSIILKICEGNIETLDQMIIDKTDGTEILTESEVDRLRDKRGYLKELMETPAAYIKKLTQENVAPEEFDPYWKDAKTMIAERGKKAR